MRRILVFCVSATVFLLAGACSSGTSPQNKVVDKVSPNTNAQNTNVIQNGNASSVNSMNSVDANVVPANDVINRRNPKLNNSVSSSTEKPKITFIPAPHNSEIATKMGDGGEFIQIRNFKSDNQLKSIEQIVTSDKLKVFLKNGKVLEVTVDKDFTSEKFVSLSPQEILMIAGLIKKPDESQTGSK